MKWEGLELYNPCDRTYKKESIDKLDCKTLSACAMKSFLQTVRWNDVSHAEAPGP